MDNLKTHHIRPREGKNTQLFWVECKFFWMPRNHSAISARSALKPPRLNSNTSKSSPSCPSYDLDLSESQAVQNKTNNHLPKSLVSWTLGQNLCVKHRSRTKQSLFATIMLKHPLLAKLHYVMQCVTTVWSSCYFNLVKRASSKRRAFLTFLRTVACIKKHL